MRRIAGIVALSVLFVAGCGNTAETTTTTATVVPTTTTTTSTTTTSTTTTTAAVVTTEPATTTTTTEATVASAVQIVGDDEFVEHASRALALLDEEFPDAYAAVLAYIRTIESVGAGSGMDVFTKTFRVGDETAYAPGYGTDDQVMWLAGTIVHDACHSRLYSDGEEYTGRDAELACLQDQMEALLIFDQNAFIEEYVESLVDGVDDPANDYWNDPNRHW